MSTLIQRAGSDDTCRAKRGRRANTCPHRGDPDEVREERGVPVEEVHQHQLDPGLRRPPPRNAHKNGRRTRPERRAASGGGEGETVERRLRAGAQHRRGHMGMDPGVTPQTVTPQKRRRNAPETPQKRSWSAHGVWSAGQRHAEEPGGLADPHRQRDLHGAP